MSGFGFFVATRVMEIVKKHDSGGLVWKRIKLTSTRKANAKKRLRRVWQNEAVLKACSEPPPEVYDPDIAKIVERNIKKS
ncbi:unnamed protein product [Victoria cruziana]